MTGEELRCIHESSTREMLAGIALLETGGWEGALGHFDRAVALRESTPWREDPGCAWLLAAAWLNRSDALRRIDGSLLPEAVRSLDRCIAAMGRVELEEKPAHVERLILAWINRATACGEAGDPAAALDSFERADAVFSKWGAIATPERRFMRSMFHANRAKLLLDEGRVIEGWNDARHGVDALRPLEPGDALVSQAGIRARSLACRALAELVGSPEVVEDWIAEATDAAEEALAIVKRSGLPEPSAADLVRYGAKIYRICQPQFLAAFLDEWLADHSPLSKDAGLALEMRGVLQLARVEAEARLLTAPHDDAHVQRELRILRALR